MPTGILQKGSLLFIKGSHKIEISYINNVFDNYIETALKNPNMYFKSHTGFQGLLEQAYNKFKASKTPLLFENGVTQEKNGVEILERE